MKDVVVDVVAPSPAVPPPHVDGDSSDDECIELDLLESDDDGDKLEDAPKPDTLMEGVHGAN